MMTFDRRAKIITIVFALLGVSLSGYLTYWNYFGKVCYQNPLSSIVSCGGPQRVLIFGQPTCVYGFAMFLAVAIVAIAGLRATPKKGIAKALVALGVAGTLFSGGLTIYELWILKIQFTGLPACVYGLIFYLGILVTSIVAYRNLKKQPPPPPVAPAASTPSNG